MLSRPTRSLLLRHSSSLRIIPRQRPSSQQFYQLSCPIASRRHFHLSRRAHKGLQPDSEDPEPPKIETVEDATKATGPADISVEEYHEIADEYIDQLVLTLEEKGEKGESGYDVEYSVGRPLLSPTSQAHPGWKIWKMTKRANLFPSFLSFPSAHMLTLICRPE